MQCHKRIKFHNGKVVAEQNECRHVNDILWPTPQMREELGRTCSREPDNVTREDVPGVSRQHHGGVRIFTDTYHHGRW